jgi:FAD/FMN-containing dehydrogenase
VAGQALGSGSGWLERKHGWSGDNVLAVEFVTADGELVRASAESEPELFWGARGAAPNFGVVTGLELALHPLGPVVAGGMLLYDGAEAASLLRELRDVIDAAPDELGVAIVFLTAPPEPFVPEELRGRPAVGIAGCFVGDVADGVRAFEPLRRLGPAVDMVEPMPYTVVQQLLDPITGAGMRQYWKSESLPELTDAAADALAVAGTHPSSPFTQLIIEPKGRAIARLPEDATALGGRGAGWHYVATSIWERAEDDAAGIGWARSTAAALEPHTMLGGSLNFTSDNGGDRPRMSFGEAKYARLVALKDRWDPENVFASNANIRPSGG